MTSGWPGRVRSGSVVTLPARSTSAPDSSPSWDARLDASTPAAQIALRAGTRSVAPSDAATVTDSSSMSTTVRSSSSVTPRDSSEHAALRDREGGKVVSTRSKVSINTTRDWRESMERKSSRSVPRASSAIWPAISTPVGPAPTTTNVSSARRLTGSGSVSASSNAFRRRARVASALSSDLTSGA